MPREEMELQRAIEICWAAAASKSGVSSIDTRDNDLTDDHITTSDYANAQRSLWMFIRLKAGGFKHIKKEGR